MSDCGTKVYVDIGDPIRRHEDYNLKLYCATLRSFKTRRVLWKRKIKIFECLESTIWRAKNEAKYRGYDLVKKNGSPDEFNFPAPAFFCAAESFLEKFDKK